LFSLPYSTPAAAAAIDPDQIPAGKRAQHGRMRVQVDCRNNDDPRAFYLGTRRLYVVRVLERTAEDSMRRFKVRVQDGRVFTLSNDAAKGKWQLAGVAS
jgi:hypothetical protein